MLIREPLMKPQYLQLDLLSRWICSSGSLSSCPIKRNDKAEWVARRRESPGSGECRLDGTGTAGFLPHLSPTSVTHTLQVCPRLCLSHRAESSLWESSLWHTHVAACGFSVESKQFWKALPHPLPPYIICGYSGNVRKPQMGHSTPHPSCLSGCQEGGRLRVSLHAGDSNHPFSHLAGPCGRPRQQSVPQTGE